MAFTQLKVAGNRVRVDLAKVTFFSELESGTKLVFDNDTYLTVDESYQTISNRAKGAPEAASGE